MILWNVADEQVIRQLLGHTGTVRGVAFSGDGRFAASTGGDRMVKIWNLQTNAESRSFQTPRQWGYEVVFSPDSRTILCGGADGIWGLWRIRAQSDVRTFSSSGIVRCVAVSKDGLIALSGSDDANLHVWDVATGKALGNLVGHSADICTIVFLPDDRHALTGSYDTKLKLWDIVSGQVLHTFEGHTGYVRRISVSHDGQKALSASWDDRSLRLWDLNQRREIWHFEPPRIARDAAFLGGTAAIVMAKADGYLGVYDSLTKAQIRSYKSNPGWIRCLAASADGVHVLSGDVYGTIAYSDAVAGAVKFTLTEHTGSVSAVAISADGKTGISGSPDHTVRLWDLSAGKEIHAFALHAAQVTGVTFTANGQSALSGCEDYTIRLLDFTRPAHYREFESRIRQARLTLEKNPQDAAALKTFGEYYAFRGRYDWAVDFFEQARKNGATISPLALARCYWQNDKLAEAKREFQNALALHEAPGDYLKMCIDAVSQ